MSKIDVEVFYNGKPLAKSRNAPKAAIEKQIAPILKRNEKVAPPDGLLLRFDFADDPSAKDGIRCTYALKPKSAK